MALFPRLRLSLALMPGAWALVTLLLYVWHPLLIGLPLWATTLVIAPQMVLGMIFLITPLTQRWTAPHHG